ncbi:hypothetical protein LPJ63_003347 [Coemansia sp. RSA 2711]|nr:hypothetical protein LPJ63_003347 [Coemansia sp. RSA 2711]
MKVLSTFLFLSSALAQRNTNGAEDTPVAAAIAAAATENASTPAEMASISGAANIAAGTVPADNFQPNRPGSNVPLFDFNLAPYNVALDIVAEALEKLADTMEPLDVPLPLVGPGYYLEVQVKSPKNPHAQPPIGELNPVSIEGGQAPPVTEIDIILPGDTEIHQTIILPANGQGAPVAEASSEEAMPSEEASAHASIPNPDPQEITDDYYASIIGATALESTNAPSSISTDMLTPPIPAGTESAAGPLFSDEDSTEVKPVSGSQLAQSISPEPFTPMATVSGFESYGELGNNVGEAEPSEDISAPSIAETDAESDAESPLESPTESSFAPVTEGAYGSSVNLEEQSLSTTVLPSSEPVGSAPAASSDLWGGLFPAASSSAPGTSDADSAGSEQSQLDLEPELGSASASAFEAEPASESDSAMESESDAGLEASVDSEGDESVDDGEVTMASELLPFPPFGGPQTQEPPVSGLDSASSTSPVETAATDAPAANGDNIIETISIIGAANENALESSIDAVLHSVIQDYKTESIPKAAVGFALIHPRSAATADRY